MNLRAITRESRPVIVGEQAVIEAARSSLRSQAEALMGVGSRIDDGFCRALDMIVGCAGRVVVSGIGKSGLIGRKIAATLASGGTPAFFLHAGEASHGDLGMVTAHDVVLLVSNSGESPELVKLIPWFRVLDLPIVAILGSTRSTLARTAHIVLDASVERESCPHNVVPTTSALAALALGDALATAAVQQRGLSPDDLARFHPAGSLAHRQYCRVRDIMQSEPLPLVTPDCLVGEALWTMTAGRCGLAIVLGDDGGPVGIVTDGDLRRGMQKRAEVLGLPVTAIMTRQPATIHEDAAVYEAEARMRRLRLKALVVVDSQRRVSGIIEIYNAH
ncbi:MAG: KpsF/GutQ family sugar-phosphate isomerase [Polyangiaceae bacterium]|nr:KpsF/GutQ family sugar-phosphate isomerase [Polyangiaceae bacterium]